MKWIACGLMLVGVLLIHQGFRVGHEASDGDYRFIGLWLLGAVIAGGGVITFFAAG